MNRVELKNWTKTKIKGHLWELLIPIVIAGILTTLNIGARYTLENGKFTYHLGFPLGILLFFVNVGLAYFMVKFVNDKERGLKDLFYFSKDYVRTFLTGLLESVFILLWSLLLIIPGIIKSIAYSLVTLILADEKYKDLGYMDTLKKSEELMKGHKMDYFVLQLSFIGWHLLAMLTLGILEIWIIPYQTTATYKFLDDIMKSAK